MGMIKTFEGTCENCDKETQVSNNCKLNPDAYVCAECVQVVKNTKDGWEVYDGPEFDDRELIEPEEFDHSNHEVIHSMAAGSYELTVYETGETCRWELSGSCGRTIHSGEALTPEYALRDALIKALADE